MKGKPLEMSLLFDFYGETLTEKQRELFDLYYNEDLSLAEIAEHAGITRQGVRDSIKRAEHALGEMESKLGLVARYGDTERCAGELREEVSRLRALNTDTLHSPEAEAIADRMTALLDQLTVKGEHVAGGDLLAEAGILDAAEEGQFALVLRQAERRNGTGLGQCFQNEHSRHHRLLWKMSGKKIFPVCNTFIANCIFSRLIILNSVNQQKGMSVRNQFLDLHNIQLLHRVLHIRFSSVLPQ